MHLNVVRSFYNMIPQIFGNIPTSHHFDRKPHGKQIIGIFTEHLTVKEISPPSDCLSEDQSRQCCIHEAERIKLLKLTVYKDRNKSHNHAAINGKSAFPQVEDA